MHFQEENPELSGIYNIKSEIVTKYILDVPRLLEIIEVYGSTNEGVVKSIVKQFVNLSNTLYSDFMEEIIQPLIGKLNKSIMLIKRTTDREEFGINTTTKALLPENSAQAKLSCRRRSIYSWRSFPSTRLSTTSMLSSPQPGPSPRDSMWSCTRSAKTYS